MSTTRVRLKRTVTLNREKGGIETYVRGSEYNVDEDTCRKLGGSAEVLTKKQEPVKRLKPKPVFNEEEEDNG